ncbi:MAG: enoyl-CoA hydratase family protein [Solimicrobium sp.]|jgi:enoyl-CoA hydratase/carnithine racemase|nr:enoyl-CoA hydratase family protein [Solimicrobium sp.]
MMNFLAEKTEQFPGNLLMLADYKAQHVALSVQKKIATITLNRPEKKNPLTFESYLELHQIFLHLAYADDVKAVVIVGAGMNFCSGGDVHEIIGPLTKFTMPSLLRFTRLTGELVKAMRACPQPIIAAVDGICVGAGAMLALASDIRFGTGRCKTAFLFTRVGLSGCDMGACALLPRVIGQGRATDLLYTGRVMSGEEGERWGFYNRLFDPAEVLQQAQSYAYDLSCGPTFAHGMTKKMLQQEWNMSVEQAIESEAQAQAICMATHDFQQAYQALTEKKHSKFEGN